MIGPVDDRTHRNYLFKTSPSSNSEATFAVSTEGPEVHARVQAGDGRVFLLNNDGGPRQGMKVLNFPSKFIYFFCYFRHHWIEFTSLNAARSAVAASLQEEGSGRRRSGVGGGSGESTFGVWSPYSGSGGSGRSFLTSGASGKPQSGELIVDPFV